MTAEKDDLLTDWKATYGEIFCLHDPEMMPYTNAEIALGVMLSRKMERLLKTRVIEAIPHRPVLTYDAEEL